MKRYAAVTDSHITVYLFATHPTGEPALGKGRQIDQIPIMSDVGRNPKAYETLLRSHGWIPIGDWGSARSPHSEHPCVEVV